MVAKKTKKKTTTKRRTKAVKKKPAPKKKASRKPRKFTAQKGKWPYPWMDDFLQGLTDYGTVWHAASVAGVTRRRAYDVRDECPEFAKAWKDTIERVTDDIERCAVYRARYGDIEFYQGEPVQFEGKPARKFDTTLQIFMLKTRRRKVYEQKVTLAGDPEAPLHPASNEDLMDEVMGLLAVARARQLADGGDDES